MHLVKPIFLLIILIGFSVAGLFIQKKSAVLSEKFGQVKGISDFLVQKGQELAPLSEDAKKQLEVLSERSQEVGEHSQKVLGETIKINEQAEKDERPIHEKAFEYGKYVYCRQVVDDYEENDK